MDSHPTSSEIFTNPNTWLLCDVNPSSKLLKKCPSMVDSWKQKTLLWSGSVKSQRVGWVLCLPCVLYLLPDKTLVSQRCGIGASVYGDSATHQALQCWLIRLWKQLWETGIMLSLANNDCTHLWRAVWDLSTMSNDQIRVSGMSVTSKINQFFVLETFKIALLTVWNM